MVQASSLSDRGAAGAGLIMTMTPASWAHWATVSMTGMGSSNCIITRSYWPIWSFSQARSSTVRVKLAPGQTVMRFLAPSSVTSRVMWPTPEDSLGSTDTWDTSTPAAAAVSVMILPKASSPTWPTMVTWAPSRAHCTAWLAPLPPGAVWNFMPMTVSPELGTRRVLAIRSIIKLPTTRMLGFFKVIEDSSHYDGYCVSALKSSGRPRGF